MEPNNLEQSGASQIRPSFGIGALGAWALEPSPASLLSAAPLFCNSWPCALRPKRPKALLQRQGEGEAMLELSVDLQEALQAYRWGALKTLQKERQKEPQKEPKVPQAQAKEKRGSEALESFSQQGRVRRLEPRKCKIAAHRLAKGGATAAPFRKESPNMLHRSVMDRATAVDYQLQRLRKAQPVLMFFHALFAGIALHDVPEGLPMPHSLAASSASRQLSALGRSFVVFSQSGHKQPGMAERNGSTRQNASLFSCTAGRCVKEAATNARFLGAILIPLLLSFSQHRAEEMSDMPLTKPID
ncbi:hypothetical protein AK812_SmicGene11483 [Symbiodinium microadriaticum]|uniref:Uncharacterized protein n=1 Tax=Symbiodinium microadriaticum TaxID=2951 RepID=A0A1Q9ECZ3_SYMMI|nr:hypothetical protein AK812_SmicGene11483 [Symbiodinium microadriaticum]